MIKIDNIRLVVDYDRLNLFVSIPLPLLKKQWLKIVKRHISKAMKVCWIIFPFSLNKNIHIHMSTDFLRFCALVWLVWGFLCEVDVSKSFSV